ncbi:MAG: hypothetical protein HY985_07790 [Magnetospirillum sp.]|nr:hypothetical protein [Magnetospirillum sp.]
MMTSACQPAPVPPSSAMAEGRGGAGAFFPIGVSTKRIPSRFLGNCEPTLDEMMADEVIHRVMARDGVAVDELVSLMCHVRSTLI